MGEIENGRASGGLARFYIDPETGLPHIYNHGVREAEVLDILDDPGEDWPGRRNTRSAVGQTAAGRYLQVIYTENDSRIFVITAFQLWGKALSAYRRRMRRRR